MSKSRSGWATVDITPEIGIPLGGRGPRFTGVDRILDPLSAQALVLEDAREHAILLVSLDVVGIGTTWSLSQNR